MKLLNIFHAELRRFIPYPAFWVMMLVLIIITFGVFNMGTNFRINGIIVVDKTFPSLWHLGTYLVSCISFLPLIILINAVTNDIQYRVFKQNVIDGFSRFQWLVGKLFFIFFLSGLAVIIGAGIISFTGIQSTPWITPEMYFEKFYFVGLLFLHYVGWLSIGFLLILITKRSMLSLLSFFGLFLLEKYIVFKVEKLPVLLPFQVFNELVPRPKNELLDKMIPILPYTTYDLILYACLYIPACWGLSLLFISYRDIR